MLLQYILSRYELWRSFEGLSRFVCRKTFTPGQGVCILREEEVQTRDDQDLSEGLVLESLIRRHLRTRLYAIFDTEPSKQICTYGVPSILVRHICPPLPFLVDSVQPVTPPPIIVCPSPSQRRRPKRPPQRVALSFLARRTSAFPRRFVLPRALRGAHSSFSGTLP